MFMEMDYVAVNAADWRLAKDGDEAAKESPPIWPGHVETAHWSINDPLAGQASDENMRHTFHLVAMAIHTRLENFIALPELSLAHLSDAA